jgi:putative membrane protein
MRWLAHIVIVGVTLLIVSWMLPGFYVQSFGAAVIAAIVLGVANAVVRPILIVLTFPITILTLGIFLLVINAFMYLLVSAVVPGFHVHGLMTAIIGSIITSIVSSILHGIFGVNEK